MAPLQHSVLKKVLLLYLIFLIFITSSFMSAQPRRLLSEEDEDLPVIKKKSNSTKNQTKLVKPGSNPPLTSSKSQTKLVKSAYIPSSTTSKNQTKVTIKLPSDSPENKTKLIKATSSSNSTSKSQFKKLNSTSKILPNSTLSTKKPSDPNKLTSPENKTTKAISSKESKPRTENLVLGHKSLKKPSWIDEDDDDDLVAEFRGLPSKFQESIVPDLKKISQTSRIYITKYNKEFTKGFKPYVGNKYASKIASLVSFTFIVIPLILVSLIFSRIKAYFSLQKLIIFIQIYLSIYFTILSFSSLSTGLEPLRFFYSTSQSTYVCVQVMQTLAYVLYLLLLLMYLILVFSIDTGLVTKLLGLAQTIVGLAVGLHYYMTVFHRAVMHQPPKTSWKAHALYATCFLIICLLSRIDTRKKSYMEEGGEEGKKS